MDQLIWNFVCFLFSYSNMYRGAKGDWDFQISDLVKIRDGTDI